MQYDLKKYLPTTRKELALRGWDEVDIIFFTGDAYIDHPSFGAAVIGRVLEAAGYRVAIVPQPDWHGDYRDFTKEITIEPKMSRACTIPGFGVDEHYAYYKSDSFFSQQRKYKVKFELKSYTIK